MQLPKFSLEKIIDSDRDSVFEVFSNYGNYHDLIPQHFPSVRIRSVREDVAVVEEHINLGPKEFVVMAKHVSKKPVLHKVFVIGGDIKGSHFRQQFTDVAQGTKVTVDVEIRLGRLGWLRRLFVGGRYAQYYDEILNDLARLCRGNNA